jgi:hypothetical protein
VRPTFSSLRYGRPDYGQLAGDCPTEITTGSSERSELGAFHDLYQAQRVANLRLRLQENLPISLEAGVVLVN